MCVEWNMPNESRRVLDYFDKISFRDLESPQKKVILTQ
jgi:hypothetical protein